jgi:hypothetical protein
MAWPVISTVQSWQSQNEAILTAIVQLWVHEGKYRPAIPSGNTHADFTRFTSWWF